MTNPTGKGGFQLGISGNPAGRPTRGMQSFKDRLTYWLETKTVGEIQTIVSDPKQWSSLPAIDAMVAMRIHKACGKDGIADFNALLDRLLGKPTQAITGEDGVPLIPSPDLYELARRACFLLATTALREPTE